MLSHGQRRCIWGDLLSVPCKNRRERQTQQKLVEEIVVTDMPRVLKIFGALLSSGILALAYFAGVEHEKVSKVSLEIDSLKANQVTVTTIVERVGNLKEEVRKLELLVDDFNKSFRETTSETNYRKPSFTPSNNRRERVYDPLE